MKYRVADYSGTVLGLEYQVLDDAQWKYKPDAKGAAAGLYAIKGPRADKMLKPVGMFNASRVMAEGSRLEHWLNGKLVVEIEIGSPEWVALHGASKFKNRPTFWDKEGSYYAAGSWGQGLVQEFEDPRAMIFRKSPLAVLVFWAVTFTHGVEVQMGVKPGLKFDLPGFHVLPGER